MNQPISDAELQHRIYNDPGNFDRWLNPTDESFYVGIHVDHGKIVRATGVNGEPMDKREKPQVKYFRFEPHKIVVVPVEYRYALQSYQCDDPSCRSSPGSKLCYRDHPAVVVGGKCPQLVRVDQNDKPVGHLRSNPVFSKDWVEERKVDATGRIFHELKKTEPEPSPTPIQGRKPGKE